MKDKKFNGLVDRPVNVFDLFISMYTNKMENFRGLMMKSTGNRGGRGQLVEKKNKNINQFLLFVIFLFILAC